MTRLPDIRYVIYAIKDKALKKIEGEKYLLSKGWIIDPKSTKKYHINNGGRLVKYGFSAAIDHQYWRDKEDYYRAVGRAEAKKMSNVELVETLSVVPDQYDDELYAFDELVNELKERLTKIGFI